MGVYQDLFGQTEHAGKTNAIKSARLGMQPPSPIIRAEANLLRFPLFAIHTKGLKSLDGIECSGQTTRGGETYNFTYRATRNMATLYPGPLARNAHLAFLSMLHEAGPPAPQPLTWTWYDLCRRLDIAYAGKAIAQLKQAITATAGLLIQSDLAFYNKADETPLRTQQQALHLYDRVVFAETQLPDGTVAQSNCLWLADWYRQNLDAFFTAPLDYALWRYLDGRSPIASRLYEFLLINFYGPAPFLRINYETLIQFLPVKPEKYLSAAQRQLRGALQLLKSTNVLKSFEWMESKSGLAQLHLYRGDRLTQAVAKKSLTEPTFESEVPDMVQVKELRNTKPPEWHLVAAFYKEWAGQGPLRPSAKELAQAKELITQYGPTKAMAIIGQAIKRMKVKWPDAKAFAAVSFYVPEAVTEVERAERRKQQEKLEIKQAQDEDRMLKARREQEERLEKDWKAVWYGMTSNEQEAIIAIVKTKFPRYVGIPRLFEKRCILELAAQREKSAPRAA